MVYLSVGFWVEPSAELLVWAESLISASDTEIAQLWEEFYVLF